MSTRSLLRDVFEPNRAPSRRQLRSILSVYCVLALSFWCGARLRVLPGPIEVARALHGLWFRQGLGRELLASLSVNVEALVWMLLLALPLSYLSVVPVLRPLAQAAAKGRFLGLTGLSFALTLLLGGGRPLKVALLVFGMGVFFVTAMSDVVAAIPAARFDHARTLRMSEWQVVWEVVIRGSAADAAEILRQNAAIGWMMLPLVEGMVRSEGGIGAMLLSQNRHFHLAEVFAIQLLILGIGIAQDHALGAARRRMFPYAELALERRQQ